MNKKVNKNKNAFRMIPELEKLLEKVERDIRNNKNIVGPFKSAKEMNDYLDKVVRFGLLRLILLT